MVSRLQALFKQSLKQRPIVTNSVVYGTFYVAAELSQQTFNKIYRPEKPEMDFAVVARMAGVGSCVYAPTLYFWYRFLDNKFAGTAIKTVAIKVAADQIIMTPLLLIVFYTLHGIAERQDDIFEELREKFWRTYCANQAFWIPGQTVNFYFVPPNLRVVYVALMSFVWINVMCSIKRQKFERLCDRK